MSRVTDWASEHPVIDVVISAAVVGAHFGAVEAFGKGDFLGAVDHATRAALFVTGAQVIAVLGGLCSIGVSVLLANQGERSLALRRHHALALRRNWRSLILTSVGAAALCMVAQGLEGATTKGVVSSGRWVFEFAVLLSVAAVIRLVWLVGGLMAVGDADLLDERRPPPPALGPRWHRGGGPGGTDPHHAERIAV